MSVELPSSPGIAEQPDDLEAGSETKNIHRTVPISHGAACSMVFDDDNDIYDSCRELWYELDLEPGEGKLIKADIDYNDVYEEYAWVFTSSKWKAGKTNDNGNHKRWYDYELTLRGIVRNHETGEIEQKKLPVSCNVVIEPGKAGMTYEDGNEVDLPYGVGSKIWIQTTYVERPSTVRRRAIEAINDLLDLLDGGRSIRADDVKPDSQRITKMEAHYRFSIDLKAAAVRTIEQSERLVDYGGGSEIDTNKDRVRQGWLEVLTTSNRWNWIGVEPATTTVIEDGEETEKRLERGLKVYQTEDWHKKPKDDWAHHPKIEAFTAGDRNPHISEWHEQLDKLRELVVVHSEWAGISDDDLISDPHFDPNTQPVEEFEHPEGRRKDLLKFFDQFGGLIYEELGRNQTDAVYDILSYLTERAEQGVTYNELVEITGYTRSTINYHISRLKESGLVDTLGNPAVIVFTNDIIKEQADEAIDNAAARRGEETMSDRQDGREERSQERRERRESGEANGTDPQKDEEIGDDARDENDEPRPFVYLNDHPKSVQMVFNQFMDPDHPRTERDIRARLFEEDEEEYDPPDEFYTYDA